MSRLAVVTGGSRGIGRAVAQLLASRGCRVAVVSRDLEAALAAVASLDGGRGSVVIHVYSIQMYNSVLNPGDHVALRCDVSQEQDVRTTFETIQKTCGKISYLVNSAGINRDGLLLRQKASDMRSLLGVNLLGSMLTCRAALPGMMHNPGAAVLNMGSVVGMKGRAGQSVYSASKAGLEGFTHSLAKEVASRGVRVNMLIPGFIRTDMTTGLQESASLLPIPLGRVGEVEEVAQAAVFLLLSPYVTGHALLVDGGVSLNM
ncbi:Carbonyl reductase family member 4 [Merluccius polli]|uniref:3-ketoacyl-[acyl-carrier-protein] reductase beta subunit n=1 Tax=Merluccius polli TaxID=89951 RepID=A0AA47MYE1_MERPO|nr:Carbonyl reductase family member 4 [Merluccius polli]